LRNYSGADSLRIKFSHRIVPTVGWRESLGLCLQKSVVLTYYLVLTFNYLSFTVDDYNNTDS